jgi:Protein of unknown function (DUF3224)
MKLLENAKRTLSLLAILLLAPVTLASSAAAGTVHRPAGPGVLRVTGEGKGTTSTILDTRHVGSRTFTHIRAGVVFTGDIAATGVEVFTSVTGPSGSVRFHGYGAFAGTIGSRWGTFEYHFTGHSTASGLRGVIRFDSGMDQLRGLRGFVRWHGPGATFSYAGRVHFGHPRHRHQPPGALRTHVDGTGTGTTPTVLDSRHLGARTLTHELSDVVFSGDIAAKGTEVFTVVTGPSGSVRLHGYGIFAGTIAGRWGLFRYHFTGAASASGLSGVIVFDSGREQLAGLRGHIRWHGAGATFSYDGHVRFRGRH